MKYKFKNQNATVFPQIIHQQYGIKKKLNLHTDKVYIKVYF